MKTRTMLRLDNQVIGYLHYFVREGIAPTINEVVNLVLEGYAKTYAEVNEIDYDKMQGDSLLLYDLTRTPRSKKKGEL